MNDHPTIPRRRLGDILCAICLILLCCAPSVSAAQQTPDRTEPVNPIADLMLIYDGGPDRPTWTADRFKPYVCREEKSRFEWLFDGFLFIEFQAKSGARLCPITSRPDATKADWIELMDHYFQDDQSIGGLNALMESLAAKGHKPDRKRQVVITLPTPITGSDPYKPPAPGNWGELDGKKMDFTVQEDRVRVATWYVDEVLKRWEAKRCQHLELAGFYWVFERAWKVHSTDQIGNYIRSKGLHLYWIPSWPQGRTDWKRYGFDFVYQQPNYFFHRRYTEPERLDEACKFAEGCGTTMEMEFNRDLLGRPEFLTYFDEYLAAYRKYGVWRNKPVAYYEGAGAWADMAASTNAAVQSRYEKLSRIVSERQKKADGGFVFSQSRQR